MSGRPPKYPALTPGDLTRTPWCKITSYCMLNIFIGIVIQKLFESTVEMETLNNQLSEVPRHPHTTNPSTKRTTPPQP